MSRARTPIAVLLAVAGAMTFAGPATAAVTGEMIEPLVQVLAFKEHPTLSADARFDIEEIRIEGLIEQLHVQVFIARLEGTQDAGMLVAYYDGGLARFGETLGGSGLMSAVVDDSALYFTFSYGSGIHRSQLGCLTTHTGALEIVYSPAYWDADVFVAKASSRIRVEAGRFLGFNSWDQESILGWVKREDSSIGVVNDAGEDVTLERRNRTLILLDRSRSEQRE